MSIPPELIDYLAARDRQRNQEIADALSALTLRERLLVKEAAVMGYVRAATLFGGTKAQIPPDSVVLCDVIAACLTMPGLYPTIAQSESPPDDCGCGALLSGSPLCVCTDDEDTSDEDSYAHDEDDDG